MRFEERELKSYAEPVISNLLTEGEVYFSVQFADEDMLIPILEAWVFAGRKLDPKDVEGHLYLSGLGVVPARYPLRLCHCRKCKLPTSDGERC
jgi:hypothetical protein